MTTLGQLHAENEQARSNYGALPAGTYKMAVEEALMKTPKAGGADYLNIRFTVVGEKYAGKKVFMNYNVNHSGDVPRRIARGQYTDLAVACGAPADTDVATLFLDPLKIVALVTNKVLFVKVNVKEEVYQGETSTVNSPNGYYSLSSPLGQANVAKTLATLNTQESFGNGAPVAESQLSDVPF